MFDRFTDRARKSLSFARQEAERFNHDYIGTEHILLGLVKEGSGVAANVLEKLGIKLETVRLEVEKLMELGSGKITKGAMPFTPRGKKVLEFAVDEARAFGHNYVGTEHLLLGLLHKDEGLAAQTLQNLGLELDVTRKAVLEFLGKQPRSQIEAGPMYPPTAKVLNRTITNKAAPTYNAAPHLETLLARQDLTPEAATEVAEAIIAGKVGEASIAALLMALRIKGESVAEIAAFAKVMRTNATPVQAPPGTLDTCGTGGDRSGTFNISTAAALVAAGMGIPVAKHGGRSVSSSAGSADVLKALGVNTDATPACIEQCIKEAGIGFMFAPAHHPGMKHVAPVRKELGVRTIFNLLGPLANPAGAKLQLLGVCEPAWCEKLAAVLKLLGSESAMVVCGAGPEGLGYLDEVSTFGPTKIARLDNGQVTLEEIEAKTLGFESPRRQDLLVSNAEESAALITAVLNGKKARRATSCC